MNIQAIYDYAKLATFCYVDLSALLSPKNIDEIIYAAAHADNPGATERIPTVLGSQMFDPRFAADITGRWTLLDPYFRPHPDTGHSDPASGFAAMLLENDTYGKVMAIAGTEPGAPEQWYYDLAEADGREIGFWGIAFKQLVSLFNYVQELRAPEGEPVIQLTVQEGLRPESPDAYVMGVGPDSWIWLESDMTGHGRGLLQEGEKISVTGHSLGGHLSALAVALFPDLFEEAFTFNAPGFNPPTSAINFPMGGADQLLALLKPYGAQPIAVESISSKVHTFESEDLRTGDDGDVIAGNATGQPFSDEHYISTEKVSHDVGHMLDSLAVQAFMARLNPSLSDQETGVILDALNCPADAVLEAAVEKLYIQIVGHAISLDRTTPGQSAIDAGDFNIRSQLYDRLIEMQNKLPELSQVNLLSLVSLSASEVISLAEGSGQVGLAYRFALEQLNPFVVIGGLLPDGTSERLALYDSDTGVGNITSQWISDRSVMLRYSIELALINGATDPQVPYVDGNQALRFEDRSTGLVIHLLNVGDVPNVIFGDDSAESISALAGTQANDRFYGGAGNDTLKGEGGNDYLEGGNGNDVLIGNAGADSLRGMDDQDTLTGNEGDDDLEGGKGNDTYVFHTGDGFDRIVDADGQGSLQINEVTYSSATRVAPSANCWLSEDGLVRFTLSAAGEGEQTLVVEYGNQDRILIQNFKLGDLGLTLGGYRQDTPVVVPVDPVDIDQDGSEPGVQYGRNGSAGSSDDRLDGGMQDDDIHAGYGQDTLVGGAGSDRLFGQEGNDQLFAEQPLALGLAAQSSDQPASGVRGDWLDGGSGNDTLVGGVHDDALHGGEEQDLLIGGDGDDNLTGDGVSHLVASDWRDIRETVVLAGNLVGYQSYFSNAEVQPVSVGGDDQLLGGAGNDWLVGNAGNDLLDGGTGFDVAFGEAGNDTLLGGRRW